MGIFDSISQRDFGSDNFAYQSCQSCSMLKTELRRREDEFYREKYGLLDTIKRLKFDGASEKGSIDVAKIESDMGKIRAAIGEIEFERIISGKEKKIESCAPPAGFKKIYGIRLR